MALFSERYGYKNPKEVFIREHITREIENAICSAYNLLDRWLNEDDAYSRSRNHDESFTTLEQAIWVLFMNERLEEYHHNKGDVINIFFASTSLWYERLDLIEFSIKKMRHAFDDERVDTFDRFIKFLNDSFERLCFAYRIIGDEVVEITKKEEIVEIEETLKDKDGAAVHINWALENLSKRPIADYRNSIKESISAVEFVCREMTGDGTLGEALKTIRKKGIEIPQMLTVAFEKLYVYTNDKTTGIRHALMDDVNEPGFEEAKFMLVACCAFVNYIKTKMNNQKPL